VGTQALKLKEPVDIDKPTSSDKAILTIQPRSSANDHEASTSKAKPRDPKYTQPKWCPLGLTKTKKRRLQRMRNQEKVENEAHPVPSKKWVRKQVEDTIVPMIITTILTPSQEGSTSIVTPSRLNAGLHESANPHSGLGILYYQSC
jgi:hypothetical protein